MKPIEWVKNQKEKTRSAWFTTYNIDLQLFEDIIVSNLNPLDSSQIIVFTDVSSHEEAARKYDGRITGAGSRYDILPIYCYGVFHPKVWLIETESGICRALIGSGNITAGGMLNNHEIFWQVEFDPNKKKKDTDEETIIAGIITFLSQLAEKCGGLSLNFPNVRVKHKRENALFIHSLDEPLWRQIFTEICKWEDGRKCKVYTIQVVSPFFQEEKSSFAKLITTLGSKKIDIAVQQKTSNLQKQIVKEILGPPNAVRLFEGLKDDGRFLHAKLLQIETAHNAYLFAGSANFTLPALLYWGKEEKKRNIEAGILVRGKPKDFKHLWQPPHNVGKPKSYTDIISKKLSDIEHRWEKIKEERVELLREDFRISSCAITANYFFTIQLNRNLPLDPKEKVIIKFIGDSQPEYSIEWSRDNLREFRIPLYEKEYTELNKYLNASHAFRLIVRKNGKERRSSLSWISNPRRFSVPIKGKLGWKAANFLEGDMSWPELALELSFQLPRLIDEEIEIIGDKKKSEMPKVRVGDRLQKKSTIHAQVIKVSDVNVYKERNFTQFLSRIAERLGTLGEEDSTIDEGGEPEESKNKVHKIVRERKVEEDVTPKSQDIEELTESQKKAIEKIIVYLSQPSLLSKKQVRCAEDVTAQFERLAAIKKVLTAIIIDLFRRGQGNLDLTRGSISGIIKLSNFALNPLEYHSPTGAILKTYKPQSCAILERSLYIINSFEVFFILYAIMEKCLMEKCLIERFLYLLIGMAVRADYEISESQLGKIAIKSSSKLSSIGLLSGIEKYNTLIKKLVGWYDIYKKLICKWERIISLQNGWVKVSESLRVSQDALHHAKISLDIHDSICPKQSQQDDGFLRKILDKYKNADNDKEKEKYNRAKQMLENRKCKREKNEEKWLIKYYELERTVEERKKETIEAEQTYRKKQDAIKQECSQKRIPFNTILDNRSYINWIFGKTCSYLHEQGKDYHTAILKETQESHVFRCLHCNNIVIKTIPDADST